MDTKMYSSNIPLLIIIFSLIIALTMASKYPFSYYNYDDYNQQILNAHNDERVQVAKEANVHLPPLVWNNTVASYALNYANLRSQDCKMIHSGGPYGENLAEGYVNLAPSNAVGLWVAEKSYYDYYSNTCAQGQVCGHYTQVVWKHSTQLGCARDQCSNGWDFVICNYYPPGNYIGEHPY